MGSGALLLGLSELARRAMPEVRLVSPQFDITALLRGQLVDSNASSDILYRSLRMHTLDEARTWEIAPIPIVFLPDKTLLLKAAEGLALGVLGFLALERLTNRAPLREPQLQAVRILDAYLKQRVRAYRSVSPALARLLAYRPPRPRNIALAASGGAGAAHALGNTFNIGIDLLAARIGGTPIHGAIASRTVFESLAFIALQDTFVSQARIVQRARPKVVSRDARGRVEAWLHTFQIEANGGHTAFFVHVLQVAQPEASTPCYVHASSLPAPAGEQTISATLEAMHPQQDGKTYNLGHHFDPAVDWLTRGDALPAGARLRGRFLALGVHNTPDGVGVRAPSGRVLAFTPLSWASPAASNFGQRVNSRRRLAPSEYNVFCLKGALWTPALHARHSARETQRDLLEHRPLWEDLWTGPTAIEYTPPDDTTRRALHILPDRIEVLPAQEAADMLLGLAQHGDTASASRLTLLRGGPIVRPGEIPAGRVDDPNINDKSAINWMVLRGGKIQGFVTGLQTMRFEYAVEIPLVRALLEQVGMDWEYLVDCDEHTAGRLQLPASEGWIR